MKNGGYIMKPTVKGGEMKKAVLCHSCAVQARRNGDIHNDDMSNFRTDAPCDWCGDGPNPANIKR